MAVISLCRSAHGIKSFTNMLNADAAMSKFHEIFTCIRLDNPDLSMLHVPKNICRTKHQVQHYLHIQYQGYVNSNHFATSELDSEDKEFVNDYYARS